jgi:SAM-dependent methyltransferase
MVGTLTNIVIIRRTVLAAIVVGGAYAFTRQCRRPTGWLGRRVARAMNVSHGGLTRWGLQHLQIEPAARILDIGCGGGQTVRTLSAMAPSGHVDGVDYAPASLTVARQRNKDLVDAGRVALQRATVSQLPFADASFDLATAVETHYYWPDLSKDFREVLRVLKPGGRFAIIAETYKGRSFDWLYRPVMTGLLRANYLTLEEHGDALRKSGFADVEVRADRVRGWVCAIGVRPPLP